MNLLIKFAVLSISLMLSVWACANINGKNSARCDHAKPKMHVVKVTLDKDTTKKPSVDKDYVVACFGDTIVFEAKEDADFSIKFKERGGRGPFEEIPGPARGKATGKVTVDPPDCAESYKYDVVDNAVPKRPKLDPRIIITPR